MDKETIFIGYGGAAYGGKSFLMCYWIVTMCIAYPDTAWGLGRKELSNLKKTTLLTLFKVLAECSISLDMYKYNQQLNIITFFNNSQIFLIDTAYKPSDPLYTRFGGYELTGMAIDESAETEIEAINILFTRTGRRNNHKYGIKRKFLETFNPVRNHVYNRYYKPYSLNQLKKDYAFIQAFPKDNPSLDVDDYVQGILDNADKVTIQRLIYGNFEYDDDPAVMFDYDAICDIFTNDHVPAGELRISADLAMQGRDRFIAGHWTGLIANLDIDQPKSTGKSIVTSLEQLKNDRGVPNSRIVADSDGLGAYLSSYIENIKAFHGNAKANDEEYANLKSECGFKLAEVINNRELKVNCTPDQQESIKNELSICLRRHRVDADESKKRLISIEKAKESLQHSPDYFDWLLMGMYFEVKKEYNIFA